MSSGRLETLPEQARQDYRAARRVCDAARRAADGASAGIDVRSIAMLLADLELLEGIALAKGAFWTAPSDEERPPPSLECGSVKGAQAHHRAGEPLCTVCQAWSDERHLRTTIEPGSRCGTPAGAQMHRQLGEKVCGRCLARKQRPAKSTRTFVLAGTGSGMTLAELARFVEQAFQAGASGAETVTAATYRLKQGSLIREARLEIPLERGQKPNPAVPAEPQPEEFV